MSAFLLRLQGIPRHGEITVGIIKGSRHFSFTTSSAIEDRLRHITERLVGQIEAVLDPREHPVDYTGPFILIKGVDDAVITTTDPELDAYEIEVAPNSRLDPVTRGIRKRATSVATNNPDQQVLGALARMTGHLSRAAKAQQALQASLVKVERTFAEGTRATLLGMPLPSNPTPGVTHPITATPAVASSVLTQLGANTGAMMNQMAGLSDARARQLEAIRKKEEEAKTGTPPAAGNGNPPSGTGSPVSPPSPTGGGGGGGSGQPGGTGTPSEDLREPFGDGSEEEAEVRKACLIWIYRFDGIEIVIGETGDGRWRLSRGQGDYVYNSRGVLVYDPEVYDFGMEGDGDEGDPDLKRKLDELIERRRSHAEEQGDPWASTRALASFFADLTPIVGDVKGLVESLTGENFFTGEELSPEERAFGFAAALVGLLTLGVGSTAVRAGTKTADKIADAYRAGAASGRLTGEAATTIEETILALRRERLAARSRPSHPLRTSCEIMEELQPGRAGRRFAPDSCFAPGTLVALPAGEFAPIEQVNVGWTVVTAGRDAPAAQTVVRISNAQAAALLELRVMRDNEESVIRCTPNHRFATNEGFTAAGKLSPGLSLHCLDGARAVVTATREIAAAVQPVFNLQVSTDHTFAVSPARVIVHNGPPCPSWKSMTAAQRAVATERLTSARSALLAQEGRVGSYAEMADSANDSGRKYRELHQLRHGLDSLPPASEVITPNHIPPASLLRAFRHPNLNRKTGGAINMTMARHLDMRTTHSAVNDTRNLGAARTNREYIDLLNAGRPKAEVFQKALRDDLDDMLRISPQLYGPAAQQLVDYYKDLVPGLMRGFKL